MESFKNGMKSGLTKDMPSESNDAYVHGYRTGMYAHNFGFGVEVDAISCGGLWYLYNANVPTLLLKGDPLSVALLREVDRVLERHSIDVILSSLSLSS